LNCAQVEDVRLSRIDKVLDEISAYLLFDNINLERLTLEEFCTRMADFTRLCAADVAGKSYRVEEALSELVAMLYRRATAMLKECVEVTGDTDGMITLFAYRTIRRQTNSQRVSSPTRQLADWTIRTRLFNPPTSSF